MAHGVQVLIIAATNPNSALFGCTIFFGSGGGEACLVSAREASDSVKGEREEEEEEGGGGEGDTCRLSSVFLLEMSEY